MLIIASNDSIAGGAQSMQEVTVYKIVYIAGSLLRAVTNSGAHSLLNFPVLYYVRGRTFHLSTRWLGLGHCASVVAFHCSPGSSSFIMRHSHITLSDLFVSAC